MRRFLVIGTAVIVFVALPLFADEPDAAAIYKAKCAMCHGADGKGQTPMGKNLKLRDLGSEDVQKMKGEELEKVITDGKGKMPAYKGKLSEADIDSLVKFIRTFAPKK